MTKQEAIMKLNALEGSDPETDHGMAEDVVMTYLRTHKAADLADAFEAASSRCGFWYA